MVHNVRAIYTIPIMVAHVKMYFHNSFQYMQKSATYAAKSFQLCPQTSWPGALPVDPHHLHPTILAISPKPRASG